MTIFKSKTLEHYITIRLILVGLVILSLCGTLLWQWQWSLFNIAITLGLMGLGLVIVSVNFYYRMMSGFSRALLHIEAVRMEDYNQYAKSEFELGVSGDFHRELKTLSQYLLTQKSRYDQHAFLVYQLIDQLNTPILVFNQKQKLSYANGAFTLLYDQPWQMYRQASPKLLGIELREGKWILKGKENQWQISTSEFIDSGESHYLLVFTNIESALRASQQTAWQQIIRVMGHEIRNSLTPVSSMAESLATRVEQERDQKALALISDRCHHLQDFVSRYSSLSQQLDLNLQPLVVSHLAERLKGFFPTLSIKQDVMQLWGDQTFLEQVLINLVKNAYEAEASEVELHFYEDKEHSRLSIIDNGHGFANLDNLFVPLFTTKQHGQGIGLSFCRNIVEQHQGSIALTNNLASTGVTVNIRLPKQTL